MKRFDLRVDPGDDAQHSARSDVDVTWMAMFLWPRFVYVEDEQATVGGHRVRPKCDLPNTMNRGLSMAGR